MRSPANTCAQPPGTPPPISKTPASTACMVGHTIEPEYLQAIEDWTFKEE